MQSIAEKWDAIYAQQPCDPETAATVLRENLHLLPRSGVALDLASGLGANAILMAQCGLDVHAWDVSSTALSKINQYSQRYNLNIKTTQRDVENNFPSVRSYDVVTVSYFLFRPMLQSIRESLNKDGLLFYQTFTADKVMKTGPTNPDYLLATNELLSVCEGMNILVYREEGVQGDIQKGWRNQAMIVAKRID